MKNMNERKQAIKRLAIKRQLRPLGVIIPPWAQYNLERLRTLRRIALSL